MTKQFTLHSAEAYSEPSPTSKRGGYLSMEVTFFTKSSILMFEKVLNTLLPSKPSKSSNRIRKIQTTWQL